MQWRPEELQLQQLQEQQRQLGDELDRQERQNQWHVRALLEQLEQLDLLDLLELEQLELLEQLARWPKNREVRPLPEQLKLQRLLEQLELQPLLERLLELEPLQQRREQLEELQKFLRTFLHLQPERVQLQRALTERLLELQGPLQKQQMWWSQGQSAPSRSSSSSPPPVRAADGEASPRRDPWWSPPRDAWSAARKARQEAVHDGAVSIGGPSRMRQGSTATVAVTVSPDAADMERLRQEMSAAHEHVAVLETPVTPVMRVTCTGDGFTVTPLAADDQVVAIDGGATWTFNVRADATGHRALLVVVHLRIPDPVGGWITRPAVEHAIHITVSPAAVTLRFFRTNWQWVAGTAFGAAGLIVAWGKVLG